MLEQLVTTIQVTIASGGSLSGAIDTGGLVLCGLQMPAAWDTADITFQGAADLAANVANVFDNLGSEVTVKAAAAQFVAIPASLLAGAKYLKVRSGTNGTPVNQSANRTLSVVLRTV